MATEKVAKTPKMKQTVTGEAIAYEFDATGIEGGIPAQTYSLSDFPQNVRDFFALFGMRTKLRNFTTPDADQNEATPAQMAEKLAKGAALLKQGLLKTAREAGEKGALTTLILEAALIYKRLKAEAKGQVFEGDAEAVAKELEGLTDEQVEQLKGTTLFQLAMSEAKEARQKAKTAALKAKALAEAAAEADKAAA
jgi:phosphoribosylformylglycinamidine (FGAM) synthase PurS component